MATVLALIAPRNADVVFKVAVVESNRELVPLHNLLSGHRVHLQNLVSPWFTFGSCLKYWLYRSFSSFYRLFREVLKVQSLQNVLLRHCRFEKGMALITFKVLGFRLHGR